MEAKVEGEVEQKVKAKPLKTVNGSPKQSQYGGYYSETIHVWKNQTKKDGTEFISLSKKVGRDEDGNVKFTNLPIFDKKTAGELGAFLTEYASQ